MKETNWILIVSMVVLVLGLITVLFCLRPIFDVKPTLIKKMSLGSKKMEFYYIGGNATMNDCIQVRLIDDGNHIVFSKSYEGYNFLMTNSFSNDTVLIVLSDTSKNYFSRQDTFLLIINDYMDTYLGK